MLITSSLNLRNKGEALRGVFVNSTSSQEKALNYKAGEARNWEPLAKY